MPEHAQQPADLLIAARWVVPVEPHGAVLQDHAVVITGGRIIAVLPATEATRRYRAAQTIERQRHVVLPGLINTHTHAAMTLFRGLADDLPLDRWLSEHIWPAESRRAGPEFVRDGTRLAILEMLRGGTTCFNDMYYFPDVVADLAVEHHIRAVVGMIVIEQPTPWAKTTEEYFVKGLAVHDQYRGHPLVRTAFAPHAPYTVSNATLRHLRLLADELDVPVHMHVHETASEVEQSLRDHGQRPLARLDAEGLVSPLLAAVHMTEISAAEIALLAERGASVVHCPESNLKLASGFCPVSRLRAAGVNTALGTDGAASNNDLDMFSEMRTAAVLGKAVARDACAVPAEEALAMATLNGARALGLGEEIGSIVPGKYADLICVDLDRPASQPVYHVISQLVYSVCRDQVRDAWVAGQPVLADGRTPHMDEADILARAEAWRRRLADGDV
jgi:5-methylthioadenosine/S-adenosylhomocysteine deaminase